jgi:nucleotide-binding universal stress UspA family protein
MANLMVCVDLSNESVDLIKKDLSKRNLESYDEIHFIHGFQVQVYADSFYFCTYPQESEYTKIESSVVDVLKTIEKEIGENLQNKKVINKCLISRDPRESVIEYVNEQKIDRMYIATRGKHGIAGVFSSSFAEHMVRHAPCELIIVRA